MRVADHDLAGTHHLFRVKLDGAGFGVLAPFFFFVSTGVTLDVHALASSPATVAAVPESQAALVAAGLVSVVVLAAGSFRMLRSRQT